MSEQRGGHPRPLARRERSGWLKTQVLLLAATGLSVLSRGYTFGREDQNLYLPFVLRWLEPALFPHDALLAQPFARQSLVWPLLAWLSRWFDLQTLCLVLWVMASYGVVVLTYKTALAWWKDERAAWIALALWVPTYSVPGVANPTFDDYFTTRILGTLCGMGLTYSVLRLRPLAAAGWTLAGGLAHIISVAPVAVGAALSQASKRRWGGLAGIAAGLALAALALVLLGGAGPGVGPMTRYTPEWLRAVLLADPEIFPHRWPATVWYDVGLVTLALFGLYGWRWRTGAAREGEGTAASIGAGILLCQVVGVAGSALGIVLVVEFCFLRATLFTMWLLALYVGGLLPAALAERRWTTPVGAAWVAGSWVAGAPGLALLAIPVLAWPSLRDALARRWGGKISGAWAAWVLAVVLGLLLWSDKILFYGFGLNAPEWFESRGASFRAMVFAVALVLAWIMGWTTRARTLPYALGGALVLTVLISPTPAVSVWIDSIPGARSLYGPRAGLSFVAGATRRRGSPERDAMAALVREQVPQDATVLVPPDWMSFRIDARRSPYVTYKDGAPAEFDRAYAAEWMRRMDRIKGFVEVGDRRTQDPTLNLSESEIVALAREERALSLAYLVSPRDYTGLLPLGEAGGMRLYKIPPVQVGGGQAANP
jgi:hypothetical protein